MANYLQELEEAIKLAEKGRGTPNSLMKAQPVQIGIYNAFTRTLSDLKNLKAIVEDSQGIYMKGRK